MRWVKERPREGMYRRKTRFLFLPRCIEGECRWFEVCTWEQTYTKVVTHDDAGGTGYSMDWVDRVWIEE